WSSWLWISSALSGTALSSVMAPQRNRHPARFDVQFSSYVRLVEHASQYHLAGQRLALDEALKGRHGRDDVRRAGHAQLDPGGVLIARLLAQPLDAVHELARQALLDQVVGQPGVDGDDVRTVRLDGPIAHHLARDQHVLGVEGELPRPYGVPTFERRELFRRELRHHGGRPGRVLAVTFPQAAEFGLALEAHELVVRPRDLH